MDIERLRVYFNDPKTVEHYMKAVANVGLWESERILFDRHFEMGDSLLDLGCGAGRITMVLKQLGFEEVVGADLAEKMVTQAKEIAGFLKVAVPFRVEDATRMRFPSERFDGVIFGFNGLMQIPGRSNRRKAMQEVRRVVKPGGRFIFTTLDREDSFYATVFKDKTNYAHDLSRNSQVLEYGDRHFETEHGITFMHVPTRSEVLEDLEACDWERVDDCMRSEIADESPEVEAFSENCRFWVAKKPML